MFINANWPKSAAAVVESPEENQEEVEECSE